MQLQNIDPKQLDNAFKARIDLIKSKIKYKFPHLKLQQDDLLMVDYYQTKFGADILTNELSLIPFGKKIIIHVTIYLHRKIARIALGNYSIDFIFVLKGKDGQLIQRDFLSPDEDLIGCTAKLTYYDASGNIYTMNNYVLLKEYKKEEDKSTWNTKTLVMLKKVAEAGVLRMVVPEMQNMYIKEELEKEMYIQEELEKNVTLSPEKIEDIQLNPSVEITDEQYSTMVSLQKRLNYNSIKSKEDMEIFLTNKGGSTEKYLGYLEKKLNSR